MVRAVFKPPQNIGYNSLEGNLWVHYGSWVQLFKISKLTELVTQDIDPKFVQILKRIREGSHTDDEI